MLKIPTRSPRAATAAATVDADCHDAGCAGFTASRRSVLRGLAAGGVTTVTGSAVTTIAGSAFAGAAVPGDDSILVVVSLRGAADGLSMVVPHGDPVYYQARPRIAVPSAALLGKDSFFGLHPAMRPLLPMWTAGELGAIHATGLPVANRSHFAAMEELEDADPGSPERSGWLNRLLGESQDADPLEGLAIVSGTSPTSLYGDNPAISFSGLDKATLAGDNLDDPRRARRTSLIQMWEDDDSRMGRALRGAITAMDQLGPAATVAADNSARYPKSDLGRALSTLAQTLRAGVDARLVTIDSGSWDHHTGVGTPSAGRFLSCIDDLAASMAAFFGDLGAVRPRVTLVTISEFGRRVVENSSMGLDHGWGNAMLVAGAGVSGGRYYGRWTGLVNALDADVPVTTDYRSVLAEIVAARFPYASTSKVFPQFTRERVGFMQGQ